MTGRRNHTQKFACNIAQVKRTPTAVYLYIGLDTPRMLAMAHTSTSRCRETEYSFRGFSLDKKLRKIAIVDAILLE